VAIAGGAPDDFNGVKFPAKCSGGSWHSQTTVVQTLFTLEPTDGVTEILTTPAGLVTANTSVPEAGITWLSFMFNEEVAKTASTGGVRIRANRSVLKAIQACCDARVQILEGFTSITDISASTDAQITAIVNSTGKLEKLSASTGAKIGLQFLGGTVGLVGATTNGKVNLIAATVEKLSIGTNADVKLQVDTAPTSGGVGTDGEVIFVTETTDACTSGLEVSPFTDGKCKVDTSKTIDTVVVGGASTRTGKETCASGATGVYHAIVPASLLAAALLFLA